MLAVFQFWSILIPKRGVLLQWGGFHLFDPQQKPMKKIGMVLCKSSKKTHKVECTQNNTQKKNRTKSNSLFTFKPGNSSLTLPETNSKHTWKSMVGRWNFRIGGSACFHGGYFFTNPQQTSIQVASRPKGAAWYIGLKMGSVTLSMVMISQGGSKQHGEALQGLYF